MCLATVYVEDDGEREEVMRDVAWIRPKSGALELVTLVGERRLLQAEIKSINLMDSLIVLRELTGDAAPRSTDPLESSERREGRFS